MFVEKMSDLIKKGYRVEIKLLDSLFETGARVRVRLAKGDHNVTEIIYNDVFDAGVKDESILAGILTRLEERYEVGHA